MRTSLLLSHSVLAALACVLLAPSAQASRQVRIYEVQVPAGDPDAAYAEAMRQALVRATGQRDAAQDPALAPLVRDARRYVLSSRSDGGAGLVVSFDGASVERAIVAAGQGLWPATRPVALVVLANPPPGADANLARRQIEDTARARGLPVTLLPAAAAGLSQDGEVTVEAALTAAQRQGADVLLFGRGEGVGWSWTLFASGATERYEGPIPEGVHGAADRLAKVVQGGALAQPDLETSVLVNGIQGLRDYARVQRALASAAGVRSATLVEASGGSAVFRVVARGGADGLAAVLAGESLFVASPPQGGRLSLDLRP